MLFLGGFLDAPLACPLIDTLIFWLEKVIDVVHVFQLEVSFISDLQFGSFQVLNVFIAAKNLILGCFWLVFWP